MHRLGKSLSYSLCFPGKLRRDKRYMMGSSVKIKTGYEKTVYYVHSKVLSSCKSPSLYALINGGWKEFKERTIDWTEFDHGTIERFLNFFTPETITLLIQNSMIYHALGEMGIERLQLGLKVIQLWSQGFHLV